MASVENVVRTDVPPDFRIQASAPIDIPQGMRRLSSDTSPSLRPYVSSPESPSLLRAIKRPSPLRGDYDSISQASSAPTYHTVDQTLPTRDLQWRDIELRRADLEKKLLRFRLSEQALGAVMAWIREYVFTLPSEVQKPISQLTGERLSSDSQSPSELPKPVSKLPTAVFLIGPPGMGKTSLVKTIETATRGEVEVVDFQVLEGKPLPLHILRQQTDRPRLVLIDEFLRSCTRSDPEKLAALEQKLATMLQHVSAQQDQVSDAHITVAALNQTLTKQRQKTIAQPRKSAEKGPDVDRKYQKELDEYYVLIDQHQAELARLDSELAMQKHSESLAEKKLEQYSKELETIRENLKAEKEAKLQDDADFQELFFIFGGSTTTEGCHVPWRKIVDEAERVFNTEEVTRYRKLKEQYDEEHPKCEREIADIRKQLKELAEEDAYSTMHAESQILRECNVESGSLPRNTASSSLATCEAHWTSQQRSARESAITESLRNLKESLTKVVTREIPSSVSSTSVPGAQHPQEQPHAVSRDIIVEPEINQPVLAKASELYRRLYKELPTKYPKQKPKVPTSDLAPLDTILRGNFTEFAKVLSLNLDLGNGSLAEEVLEKTKGKADVLTDWGTRAGLSLTGGKQVNYGPLCAVFAGNPIDFLKEIERRELKNEFPTATALRDAYREANATGIALQSCVDRVFGKGRFAEFPGGGRRFGLPWPLQEPPGDEEWPMIAEGIIEDWVVAWHQRNPLESVSIDFNINQKVLAGILLSKFVVRGNFRISPAEVKAKIYAFIAQNIETQLSKILLATLGSYNSVKIVLEYTPDKPNSIQLNVAQWNQSVSTTKAISRIDIPIKVEGGVSRVDRIDDTRLKQEASEQASRILTGIFLHGSVPNNASRGTDLARLWQQHEVKTITNMLAWTYMLAGRIAYYRAYPNIESSQEVKTAKKQILTIFQEIRDSIRSKREMREGHVPLTLLLGPELGSLTLINHIEFGRNSEAYEHVVNGSKNVLLQQPELLGIITDSLVKNTEVSSEVMRGLVTKHLRTNAASHLQKSAKNRAVYEALLASIAELAPGSTSDGFTHLGWSAIRYVEREKAEGFTFSLWGCCTSRARGVTDQSDEDASEAYRTQLPAFPNPKDGAHRLGHGSEFSVRGKKKAPFWSLSSSPPKSRPNAATDDSDVPLLKFDSTDTEDD